jgi:hypothetical protein
MWMLEHLSCHSHGFYTSFCAGKVFPYMDGDILPVYEGKLVGIVFNTDISGKFPAFRVSQGHFPENSRIPAGRMFSLPAHPGKAYPIKQKTKPFSSAGFHHLL